MQIGFLAELWRLRALVVLAAVLAALAALAALYEPPGFEPRSFEAGLATTRILVDSSPSVLRNAAEDQTELADRAAIYARLATSDPLRERIAKLMGIPVSAISAESPIDANGAPDGVEPGAERRGRQLVAEAAEYRLQLKAEVGLPIIGVDARAPTLAEAMRLADSVPMAVRGYLESLHEAEPLPDLSAVSVRQLSKAAGGTEGHAAGMIVAALTAFTVFAALCMMILLGSRFLEAWRSSRVTRSPQIASDLAEPFR